MLKFCVTIVVGIGLIYGGMVLIASVMQRRLQYFPTHVDTQGAGNKSFKPWRDVAGQFWGYIRPAAKPKRIVILFHGNGGEALSRSWLAEMIPDPEIMLILAEYPGYGAKPGDPTEALIYQDAELVLDSVRRKWELVPITIIGESLGSGVASYVASKKKVDRLALISPFSSAAAVGAHHYPYLPVKWVMKDRYDNLSHVKELQVPLHIVHGDKDEVVPLKFSQELYKSYPGKTKTFTLIEGIGHNDIVPVLLGSPKAKSFRDFLVGSNS